MESLKSKWVSFESSKKAGASTSHDAYPLDEIDAMYWDDSAAEAMKEKASWPLMNAGYEGHWPVAQCSDAVTPSMPHGGRGGETLEALINDGQPQPGGQFGGDEINSWFQCDDFLTEVMGNNQNQSEDLDAAKCTRKLGGASASGVEAAADSSSLKVSSAEHGGSGNMDCGQQQLLDPCATVAMMAAGGRSAPYTCLPGGRADRARGLVTNSRPGRTSNAAEALALGAKRAAGLVPVDGPDMFNKVHTNTRATITTTSPTPQRTLHSPWTVDPSIGTGTGNVHAPNRLQVSRSLLHSHHSTQTAAHATGAAASEAPNCELGPAAHVNVVAPPSGQHLNFPLFARPAQRQKVHATGQRGTPGQLHCTAPVEDPGPGLARERMLSSACSFSESVLSAVPLTAATGASTPPTTDSPMPAPLPSGGLLERLTSTPPCQLATSFPPVQRSTSMPNKGIPRMSNFSLGSPWRMASLAPGGLTSGRLLRPAMPTPLPPSAAISGQGSQSTSLCRPSSLATGSAGAQQSLRGARVSGRSETQEPTVTCSGDSTQSGDYEDGSPKAKPGSAQASPAGGTAASTPKRERDDETVNTEAERLESEDIVDDSGGVRRGLKAGGSTKRSRAAEVHNLSERKRRDRINEKMKALQDLIPNSNKTDKASMLDEAIEYLKMLQMQLQVLSTRTQMMGPVHSGHSMGGLGAMPPLHAHMMPPPAPPRGAGGVMPLNPNMGGLVLGGGASRGLAAAAAAHDPLAAQQAAQQRFLMSLECQQAVQHRLSQGAFNMAQAQSLGAGGLGHAGPMGQLPHVGGTTDAPQLAHAHSPLSMLPGLMSPAYWQQVESIRAMHAQQRQQSLGEFGGLTS